ncbi:glyoxylate/hydroxypyruvate reductase A [Pontibacter diazotrophicus]|uniref:Glyoxylate/hydroxypyruvate reductase A n=1 Tax=Pontibacter diazotrophicus TaxID=1400979 RepID=A0A3D8L9Y8_9BACT|nr:glyoxylate/hydroxypyruvate reductase A [Pontibacter diazotrophicus]RDV14225.1 glyoxylate/hydroxypyruvate reductase A [Pontibacter diazotrophicus]
MSITIITQGKDLTPWVNALKERRPELDLRIYPEGTHREDVEFALAWNHPLGAFKEYPNLRCISSMGAGVDHILKDPELPEAAIITRITDPNLAKDMAEFTVALVMNHVRGLSSYKIAEQRQSWEPKRYLRTEDVTIGVMGVGVLGTYVARHLNEIGFKVNGWARTAKEIEHVEVYVGQDGLDAFLAASDILICLLPLTKETANILNKDTFRKLPEGAFVINVARGEHLVEQDLIGMIDEGHLAGASLDVFREEPLPKNHPFWEHPKINITPHIASITNPATAVSQILDNYDRLKKDEPLTGTVSLTKGY